MTPGLRILGLDDILMEEIEEEGSTVEHSQMWACHRPRGRDNLTSVGCYCDGRTSQTCVCKVLQGIVKGKFQERVRIFKVEEILVCTGVLCTHQWGHHPFAGWGDNDP